MFSNLGHNERYIDDPCKLFSTCQERLLFTVVVWGASVGVADTRDNTLPRRIELGHQAIHPDRETPSPARKLPR